MRLMIDADACPVTDIAIAVAGRFGLPVTLVCDHAHQMERPGVETLTVIRGADSADFALVNRLQKGDVVVTQDYGLAAMALARGSYPMNQNGLQFSQENIDSLLAQRHISRKLRQAGHHTKGPSKRTAAQDEAFQAALESLLMALTGQEKSGGPKEQERLKSE